MYTKTYYMVLISSCFLFANEYGGYGWNIANSSLNIGGYLDMTYDQDREDKFLFNDIAMLFSATKNRFDLLGEVELSHISLDGKRDRSSDVDLNIERLQLGYALSDKLTINIGRFNSDIGYWNQAPIPILQDTTTQPHIISNLFPKATTGLLFRENINENNSFSITLQDNKDIGHQDNSMKINRHFGMAYHGIKDDLSWRFSVGRYRDSRDMIASYYIGIGSEYDIENFSIQAEFFTQNSKKRDDKPYSGYFQSTWHFKESQDGVIRFESYDDNAIDIKEQIYLFGYAYRPTNNIAFKAEYIYYSKQPLSRYVYSLSVLF